MLSAVARARPLVTRAISTVLTARRYGMAASVPASVGTVSDPGAARAQAQSSVRLNATAGLGQFLPRSPVPRWRMPSGTMASDMGQEEHDRDAVARGRALTALVRPYLPLDVLVRGPADAWPLVGPALIARATGSLEAILALVPLRREADADTLLRSLYEHVTTFAWLAAEPGEERMRRWLKSDCEARLRTDDDCRKVGVKTLDDDRRKELEDTVAALPQGMPVVLDRAQAADAHWASRIAGLRDSTTPTSFRGLYAAAYRHFSAIAHPTSLGLNPVTVDLDGSQTRVQLEERPPDMGGPFGLATIVYALGLYVASETIAWPTKFEIDRVLTR
jgi:hypothetical protein